MTDSGSLSPEQMFQIDFNFQQVPSALAVDIPDVAAAAMLHIDTEQFTAYTQLAAEACRGVALDLIANPVLKDAVYTLKKPRSGDVSTILTVGDSITTYRYGYAEILRALLDIVEPQQNVHFTNYGRSGYTSTHGLEHTFTQYVQDKPDWVFLKYGANDTKHFNAPHGKLLVSVAEYTANMTQIIDALLKIGTHLIVLSPTPIVESIVNSSPDFQAMSITWDNADLRACADALTTITNARDIPLIDLVKLFTTNPDPALYLPDGLHPGPQGHRIIIEQVLNAVSAVTH